MVTEWESGVALVKEFRYLRAKVSMTGSFSSIDVVWSGLSAEGFCLQGCQKSSPAAFPNNEPLSKAWELSS